MAVQFQKSDSGGYPMLFKEKHIRTIEANVSVQSLVDLEEEGRGSRNFAGATKVAVNTLLCMTVGQQASMLAWIEKFKAAALSKVTKGDMTDISGIPVPGCIVKDGEAWGGGTFTFGFSKATGTVINIVHLGPWDYTGTFRFATTKVLSGAESGQYSA